MMEFKEVFKGQFAGMGMGLVAVYEIIRMAFRTRLVNPFQICVRIEEETKDVFFEYCEEMRIKPIAAAGMILNAALVEYVKYHNSFKEAEKEAMEIAIKDHEEEEKKAATKKKKCSAGKEIDVDLKE